MASIYGFTLKNRKTFQGLDWQGKPASIILKFGISAFETMLISLQSTLW